MALWRSLGAGALLSALFLASCRGTEVASVNLDALMSADNQLKYFAPIDTGVRYFLAQFLDEDWFAEDSTLGARKPEPIPDPTEVALANLLALREGAYGVDEAWIEAEQVRQYARYAVHCPSALARERSLLELGAHAERLGLDGPAGEPAVAASPAEIRLALEGLIEVLERVVTNDGLDETMRRDLASSCDLLASLELDVDGGWRLLKVIARFGLVQRLSRDELAPVLELSRVVQRGLVRQALAHGRGDEHPRARAAAVRASVRAYGDEFLREAILVMPRPGQQSAVFGLRAPAPEEEDVLVALLDEVRGRGLPLPKDLEGVERRRLRLALLFSLVQVAHDYTAYGDRVRTAAMLALAEVSGAGISTLSEPEWARWWRAYEEQERARIDAATGFQGEGEELDGGAGGGGA